MGQYAPKQGSEQAVLAPAARPVPPNGRGQPYVSLQQQQLQMGQAPGGAVGRAIPLGHAGAPGGTARLEGLMGPRQVVSPPNRPQTSFPAAGYAYGSAAPGNPSARPHAPGAPGYPNQALSLQQMQAQQAALAYAQHQKQQAMMQQQQRMQALQNAQKGLRPAVQQVSPQPNAPTQHLPPNAGHVARAVPSGHAAQAAGRQLQPAQPPMSLSQVTAMANQEVVRSAAHGTAHGSPGDRLQRAPPEGSQAASSGQGTGAREMAPRIEQRPLPILQPNPPKPTQCVPGLAPQQLGPRHRRPYRPALKTVAKARVPGLPIAGKSRQASLRTPSLPVCGVPYTRILPSIQVILPCLLFFSRVCVCVCAYGRAPSRPHAVRMAFLLTCRGFCLI